MYYIMYYIIYIVLYIYICNSYACIFYIYCIYTLYIVHIYYIYCIYIYYIYTNIYMYGQKKADNLFKRTNISLLFRSFINGKS